MSELSRFGRLKVRIGFWFAAVLTISFYTIGTLGIAYLTWKNNSWIVGVSLFIAIFVMLVLTIKWIKALIEAHNLILRNEGIEQIAKGGSTLLRWEDVSRYEPYQYDFGLFFKDGTRIRIPAQVEDFHKIKDDVLKKLEAIGTFEDGRTVSRVVFSISNKVLVLLFLTIVAIVSLVIWLR